MEMIVLGRQEVTELVKSEFLKFKEWISISLILSDVERKFFCVHLTGSFETSIYHERRFFKFSRPEFTLADSQGNRLKHK